MLTRLKVSGFKNLVDVDVSFGPFTCVAGVNGVGKSNLFDAITFLGDLADKSLLDAALCVRGPRSGSSSPSGNVRTLFHHVGGRYSDEIRFEAEMIVPRKAVDDLGQEAEAAITFLRYSLALGYRSESNPLPGGGLEILYEELTHITQRDAAKSLSFPHTPAWRKSVVQGRRASPFISTDKRAKRIQVHQDGSGGRLSPFNADSLPRTVLSSANASENPTALAARKEMQSWRLLQLEPSALRAPDPFTAPRRIAANGAHVPGTLARLAQAHSPAEGADDRAARVYAQVANRLAELIDGVRSIKVDSDPRRELFSIIVTDREGTEHEARALSDGTLRFLALSVLESDPEGRGLLCLEEPENGIHPERIPAMIRLLADLAVDPELPVDENNPLGQVIINTHSPSVVAFVPDDSLVIATSELRTRDKQSFVAADFRWLEDTWRSKAWPDQTLPRGQMLAYLNPTGLSWSENGSGTPEPENGRRAIRRVMDRKDLTPLLPFSTEPQEP